MDTPEPLELRVGRAYRAKKPKRCGIFSPKYDDRQIKWLSKFSVQYDSPSVKNGRKYPTVSREKFLSWAARDVTDELPAGDWADWPTSTKAS